MTSRKLNQVLCLSIMLVGVFVPPNVMAQDNSPARIWKQVHAMEKQGFGEMSGRNYKGAADTFTGIASLLQQLPENDPQLKDHYQTVEGNLSLIDNKLEAKGDMAMKERVVRARLAILDKTSGKNSLAYQVALKQLMYALSEQGKTADLAAIDKQIVKDTSGPAPTRKIPTIGKKSARPK